MHCTESVQLAPSGCGVLVTVGVAVAVAVSVLVAVSVEVAVAVAVGVSVTVAVEVELLVAVSVDVWLGVEVTVAVCVTVGVEVIVGVSVTVGVCVPQTPNSALHTLGSPVNCNNVQPLKPALAHTVPQSLGASAPSAQPPPPVLHVTQLQQFASARGSRPIPIASSPITNPTRSRPDGLRGQRARGDRPRPGGGARHARRRTRLDRPPLERQLHQAEGPSFAGPDSTMAVYGASKAALERLTIGLAAELYGDAIAVNSIAPLAAVRTPGADALVGALLDEHPELVEPVEWLAEAVLVLATCDARTLTGRVLYSRRFLEQMGRLPA